MWDPLEKSHLTLGSEREAGCEARIGISKNVSDKMPPEATRLVPTERMSVVLVAREAMVMCSVSEDLPNEVSRCTYVQREICVLYGLYGMYTDDMVTGVVC